MRALRTLSRCNQTLVRATEEQSFMDDVCRLVVEAKEYAAAWIELDSNKNGGRAEVARAEAKGTGGDLVEGKTLSFDLHVKEVPVGSLTIRLAEADAFLSFEQDLLKEIALNLGYGIETLRGRADHERTQEQLVAAQRLEAVGRLAGGIAHDFNNLLSVIMTYGEFAIERLRARDPIREDIEQVVRAGRRAADLTRQLLAFSHKQIMEPRVTNLNDVIKGFEAMLRRLLGEDIDIEIHAASDLGNVLADPGHLEQVVMNLAVNARDAMPEGGKLTIETRNVELDQEYADGHIAVKPGPFVQVSVADAGVGIPPEVRSQIFEPFFTTKEMGKGTGLGLSMVYGIVKQSGGHIWVYSEPGQGTTFKVYLPRVDAEVVEREQPRRSAAASGHETILLVEDEPMVRDSAERILTSAGYRVLVASNGGEALLLCEEHGARIDLVLTDVVMPNMSGQVLAERIEKLHPDLKVLFTSGYTDNAIVHDGVLDAGTQFIEKPFSVAALTAKVRSVLDSK
jgi:signal transduction histidine kinase